MSIEPLKDWKIEKLKQLKEIVDCLVDYSQVKIIQSNFIKNFYRHTIEGRIHPGYKLFGAKSFRLTCSEPNLLQIPSTGSIYAESVKKCLVTDPGWILYCVDLQALEDRVIANLSKDTNKLSVFTEGIDGHSLNSYYYFKEEIENILPRESTEDLYEYIKRFFKATETNKELKAIRQKSKPGTFACSYGAYPKKLAATLHCPLDEAESLFHRYHKELYPGITKFRDQVLDKAIKDGRIHLGLGCYLNTSEPEKEIRTLFNACSQFWSILTLLTVNALHNEIDKEDLADDVKIISTIYDSVYIHLRDDLDLIKWVNDITIPFLTTDFLEDQIVKNVAEGELGYNWFDLIKINNNASLDEIEEARNKARSLFTDEGKA
jgi:DNA polymerase-1